MLKAIHAHEIHDAGIDRFALLGISQGCAVSIAYAFISAPSRSSPRAARKK
jgi:hypothetical protein